jgi:hypothetical protein
MKSEGVMKRCFGLLIFLVILLAVPWSKWETVITTTINTMMFVVGIGCFLGVVVVYFMVTIHSLRYPAT